MERWRGRPRTRWVRRSSLACRLESKLQRRVTWNHFLFSSTPGTLLSAPENSQSWYGTLRSATAFRQREASLSLQAAHGSDAATICRGPSESTGDTSPRTMRREKTAASRRNACNPGSAPCECQTGAEQAGRSNSCGTGACAANRTPGTQQSSTPAFPSVKLFIGRRRTFSRVARMPAHRRGTPGSSARELRRWSGRISLRSPARPADRALKR